MALIWTPFFFTSHWKDALQVVSLRLSDRLHDEGHVIITGLPACLSIRHSGRPVDKRR